MAYIRVTSWFLEGASWKASTLTDTGTGRRCLFVLLHTTYQWPFLEGSISVGCCCQIFQINIKRVHAENNKEIIGNVKLFIRCHIITQ